MKKLLIAAVVAGAFVPAAHAADLIIPQVVDPVVYSAAGFDWSGFYLGVNAGYGSGNATSVGVLTGATDTVNYNGALLGLTAGVNAQFDAFVLGVEGDVAWSGVKGTTTCISGAACTGELNWLGTVRARAGVAFDSILIFATGGVAFGGINASVSPAQAGTTGSYSTTAWGWTVGAGIEAAVTENMSIKAEYAYTDLGKSQAPVGTLGLGQAYDLSPIAHTVKLGVNFHF